MSVSHWPRSSQSVGRDDWQRCLKNNHDIEIPQSGPLQGVPAGNVMTIAKEASSVLGEHRWTPPLRLHRCHTSQTDLTWAEKSSLFSCLFISLPFLKLGIYKQCKRMLLHSPKFTTDVLILCLSENCTNVAASFVLSAQTIKLMTPNVRLLQTLQDWRNVHHSCSQGAQGEKNVIFFSQPWLILSCLFSTHHLGRSLFAVRGMLWLVRNVK